MGPRGFAIVAEDFPGILHSIFSEKGALPCGAEHGPFVPTHRKKLNCGCNTSVSPDHQMLAIGVMPGGALRAPSTAVGMEAEQRLQREIHGLQEKLGRMEEQGTWASRTRKHSEAGYGRPVDRGVCTAKTVKRPRQQPAQPQYANYRAPLTRKRHTCVKNTASTLLQEMDRFRGDIW